MCRNCWALKNLFIHINRTRSLLQSSAICILYPNDDTWNDTTHTKIHTDINIHKCANTLKIYSTSRSLTRSVKSHLDTKWEGELHGESARRVSIRSQTSDCYSQNVIAFLSSRCQFQLDIF